MDYLPLTFNSKLLSLTICLLEKDPVINFSEIEKDVENFLGKCLKYGFYMHIKSLCWTF